MKKIVLIEDDSDLYALLQYNLEKEGFQMAGSKTGKGAIELCRTFGPDLILLDIMLPDSDGLDICKGIRNRPHRRAGVGRQRLCGQTVLRAGADRPHQATVPNHSRTVSRSEDRASR